VNLLLPESKPVAPISTSKEVSQHSLVQGIYERALDRDIFNNPQVTVEEKRLTKACMEKGAMTLFTIAPFRNDFHDNSMDNPTFDISLRMRLGLPVFNRVAPCPCCKKGTLNLIGTHAIVCAGKGTSTIRHDGVVAQLGSTLSEARVVHELPSPQGRNGLLADGEPADC